MDDAGQIAKSIGQRVRELRRRRGLNQQDLASDGISSSYISLIESGKRLPSDAVLAAIAGVLGCSVDYLRTGRDDQQVSELQVKIAFGEMALRQGDNGVALQSFSEALAHSPLLDAAAVRRGRLGQAQALEKLGHLEAAITVLRELFEAPDCLPGSPEWTQLAVALCRSYRNAGDLDAGITFGEQALQRLNALGLEVTDDHVQLGATLIGAYRSRGDLTHAHLLAGQLTEFADQTRSSAARASVYWNAGMVAHSRGESAQALALLDRALTLMSEGDNARHLAMLKHAYGWLLLVSDEESDPDQAYQLLEQAAEGLSEAGTAAERAECEADLALAEVRRGNFDEATRRAERATGLADATPSPASVYARVVLATAQFHTDESRAAGTLRAAGQQLARLRRQPRVATLWRSIGDLWARHGHAQEALAAYQQALATVGVPALPDTTQALQRHAAR